LTPHWKHTLSLWFCLFAGPIAWFLQLETILALSPWSAKSGRVGAMHAVTALLLCIAAASALLAWRDWRAAGGGLPTGQQGGPEGRERFLAVMGMGAGTLFSLLIIAGWIYVSTINPGVD
jgi:hypothetical protein